ncbi:MAG: TolC family protein [Flavobacteriales bacterium]
MDLGKRLVVFTLLLAGWNTSFAQDENKWSLERCISYAIENNIQIKQSALQKESARLDKTQSLAQLFPSLNASTGFNTNFGRNIDLATNTYVNEQTNSNSFYLGSNIPLFNGFRQLNGFKQSQIDLIAAGHDLQGLTNDIVMNLATAFMQVMFNEELLLVAQEQLDVTAEQLARTQKLVDAGSLPAGNVFDVEAQVASNELQVINMENALSASVLTLKQMLNLNASESFRIERPEVDVPLDGIGAKTVGTVYDHALNNWPKIKSRESKLESARKGEKIAFASYTPTLSGSASISTRYSSASFLGDPDPYGTQLDQNLGQSIGLSLNIPIFNALQSRTAVKKSHLNRINAELLLQDEKNKLYSSVQQAYNDAQAAKRQFDASDKSVSATVRAFEYAEQRYEVGMMNSLEFNTASNNLTRAKSELLRSKFDYIFKMKVLDFYQGKPITFDPTK